MQLGRPAASAFSRGTFTNLQIYRAAFFAMFLQPDPTVQGLSLITLSQ